MTEESSSHLCSAELGYKQTARRRHTYTPPHTHQVGEGAQRERRGMGRGWYVKLRGSICLPPQAALGSQEYLARSEPTKRSRCSRQQVTMVKSVFKETAVCVCASVCMYGGRQVTEKPKFIGCEENLTVKALFYGFLLRRLKDSAMKGLHRTTPPSDFS